MHKRCTTPRLRRCRFCAPRCGCGRRRGATRREAVSDPQFVAISPRGRSRGRSCRQTPKAKTPTGYACAPPPGSQSTYPARDSFNRAPSERGRTQEEGGCGNTRPPLANRVRPLHSLRVGRRPTMPLSRHRRCRHARNAISLQDQHTEERSQACRAGCVLRVHPLP
jgi:hypothetical protein